jgi:hypothetical protein
MAFLPGIFGRQQAQPQQQSNQQVQHPNQPQQQQNTQQPQQNSNGSGGPANTQHSPQNSNMNPGGNASNPLDPFAQLMTPSKDVLTARQQEEAQRTAGLFGDNFSAENVNKAVGQTNFAQGIDPAKVQAALGGDINAFMEVLNGVATSAVSTSIQAAKGMVEHGVNTGTEKFSTSLDSRFRDYEMRQQTPKNAALQHPVGKALLSTVAKQIATANPRMSASEVNTQAESMFTEFAKLLNPAAPSNEEVASKAGADWEAFLNPTVQ